jgi:hypothetical protein
LFNFQNYKDYSFYNCKIKRIELHQKFTKQLNGLYSKQIFDINNSIINIVILENTSTIIIQLKNGFYWKEINTQEKLSKFSDKYSFICNNKSLQQFTHFTKRNHNIQYRIKLLGGSGLDSLYEVITDWNEINNGIIEVSEYLSKQKENPNDLDDYQFKKIYFGLKSLLIGYYT